MISKIRILDIHSSFFIWTSINHSIDGYSWMNCGYEKKNYCYKKFELWISVIQIMDIPNAKFWKLWYFSQESSVMNMTSWCASGKRNQIDVTLSDLKNLDGIRIYTHTHTHKNLVQIIQVAINDSPWIWLVINIRFTFQQLRGIFEIIY